MLKHVRNATEHLKSHAYLFDAWWQQSAGQHQAPAGQDSRGQCFANQQVQNVEQLLDSFGWQDSQQNRKNFQLTHFNCLTHNSIRIFVPKIDFWAKSRPGITLGELANLIRVIHSVDEQTCFFEKFDLWSDKQRKWFLLTIIARCRPPQICFLEDTFENYGAAERKDFTRVLPKYLSTYILSFLSPKDLSRCAQVSSHWKFLSEQVSD